MVKIDKVVNTATKSKQKLLPCIALFWPRRFAVLLSSITKQMFFKWVPPKPLLKRNWRLANAYALFLKQKSFNLPFKIEVSLFSFGIAPLIFYLIGAPIFVFMKKKMMFSAPFSSTWHINLDGGKKRQKLAPKCITNNLGQPTLFGAYFIVNIYSVSNLVFPQQYLSPKARVNNFENSILYRKILLSFKTDFSKHTAF